MSKSPVKDLLSTGEVLLIDTRQHWMAAVRFAMRPILLGLLVFGLYLLNQLFDFGDGGLGFINDLIGWAMAILIIVTVIWLPIDLIRWDTRHYALTNRRVIRTEGMMRKSTFDSSLEQINDINLVETTFGRFFGYADLTIFTASDNANETYRQLLDGQQFKKAVLDAKEGIRVGVPLTALPDDFVVKGGTNEASMRADGKLKDEVEPETAPVAEAPPQPAAAPPPAAVEATPEPEPVTVPEPVAEPALVAEPEPEPVAEPEPATEPAPAAEATGAADEPEADGDDSSKSL